jgi:hypothetical protein
VSSRIPVAVDEPPKPERELFSGKEIPGEETQDDTDGYMGYIAEVAKEEGNVDQLPV